jgi:hypothetical protein
LQDSKVYKKITDKRRNPTTRTENDLQKMLKTLCDSGHQSESDYWKLRPFDSTAAAFYGLPKVHKIPLKEEHNHFTIEKENSPIQIPLRPINSSIGSPTYQVSKHLAGILQSLYEENGYSVKNAQAFSEFVCTQRVEKDEMVVSFDVISLFTSIPVKMAVDIVKRRLSESHNWKGCTLLTAQQVVNLLVFVLNNSFFKFQGNFFHQISECAMGSPVSAVIAELIMQEVEGIAITTSPVDLKWWKRYVDDSNSCLKRSCVQSFHDHLNSINPCIQFTIELPTTVGDDDIISFLDTEVVVRPCGNVMVAVHRKATHMDTYLSFDSHNPKQHKATVVKTLFDRADKIPNTIQGKKAEKQNVRKALSVNGYTSAFINSVASKSESSNKLTSVAEPKGYACIPYVKGISERVNRILTGANIRTAYKPSTTFGGIFKKPKDRPSKTQVKGIVYKFKCKTCNFLYIGKVKDHGNPVGLNINQEQDRRSSRL